MEGWFFASVYNTLASLRIVEMQNHHMLPTIVVRTPRDVKNSASGDFKPYPPNFLVQQNSKIDKSCDVVGSLLAESSIS